MSGSKPEVGETFVTLVLGGGSCPIFTEGEREVKGSVIGEAVPIETMAKSGHLKFKNPAIKTGWLYEGKEGGKAKVKEKCQRR